MEEFKVVDQKYKFQTDRLLISSWQNHITDEASKLAFVTKIQRLLTPPVTEFLPDEWHEITSVEDAKAWWQKMANESVLLTTQLQESNEIIGFVFFFENELQKKGVELHFGYLLGEAFWAKGYGNELIKGIIHWADLTPDINTLIGGVNAENIGSIKVLEKNGFSLATSTGSPKGVLFYKYTCA